MLHYPTCPVWETNDPASCNCQPRRGWMVREDPTQQYPWRVVRMTSDGEQEVMGCSTFGRALDLIRGFAWLKENGQQRRRKNNA